MFYILAYIHYFCIFLIILSKASGFVKQPMLTGQPQPILHSNGFGYLRCLAVCIFLYAWYHQHKLNVILANLRKNDSGKRKTLSYTLYLLTILLSGKFVTQKRFIPSGGYFEYISSPHMFFEILLYSSLYILMSNNLTFLWVFIFVIVNQTESAWLTHKWYLETFPSYPLNRRVIFPKLF